MLEVSEVSENLHFLEASGLHFGPHFRPLDVILAAFLRPGRPPGTLFGTLAVQGDKMDVFWFASGNHLGSTLDTCWAPRRKEASKH